MKHKRNRRKLQSRAASARELLGLILLAQLEQEEERDTTPDAFSNGPCEHCGSKGLRSALPIHFCPHCKPRASDMIGPEYQRLSEAYMVTHHRLEDAQRAQREATLALHYLDNEGGFPCSDEDFEAAEKRLDQADAQLAQAAIAHRAALRAALELLDAAPLELHT